MQFSRVATSTVSRLVLLKRIHEFKIFVTFFLFTLTVDLFVEAPCIISVKQYIVTICDNFTYEVIRLAKKTLYCNKLIKYCSETRTTKWNNWKKI